MDRATFESQKAFAGEKKPSMQRRCVDNDYTARRMYMVTMVTEGRKPLFGQVVGKSEAVEPSPEAPHIQLAPLGEAVAQQHAQQKRENGLLFAKGFNDQILLRDGQLKRWMNYLKDNPRRLLMKRENPDLFKVQRGLTFAGLSFSAIGNRFLLERPVKIQVQCSRSISENDLQAKTSECLCAARQGAVLVSPAISQGEKAIMRAATNTGALGAS